jgi:cysteine desulfurase
MKLPIYMDYSATTPVDPRVAEKMCACLTPDGIFGNPASRSHAFGWAAEEAVETARRQIAALVNADPKEIAFTSGATESDNLAIKGAAQFYQKRGRHIVTCKTEHKAVLDTCRQLEREGFEVTYLDPEPNGLIDLRKLDAAIRDDTVLVSIMHVNNEIGVIQDIAAIGELTRERKTLLHVDAAQSTGKVHIDLERMPVDLMSFSAHKTYGPKGIGALYVRRKPRVRLEAQMHGGGHERGLRSGTLNVPGIVGLGAACELCRQELAAEAARLGVLRDHLLASLRARVPDLRVNGSLAHRLPQNLNVSFPGIDGESLAIAMDGVAISSGSACSTAKPKPSHVLKALGSSDDLAFASLRFGLGRWTTAGDVDFVIGKTVSVIERLRAVRTALDA